MSGTFDSHRDRPLVFRTHARLPPRADLAIFRDKTAQHLNLFVIDHCTSVRTKLADTWVREESPPPSRGVTEGCLVAHDFLLLVLTGSKDNKFPEELLFRKEIRPRQIHQIQTTLPHHAVHSA